MKIVGISSGKGGVGKSTICANLAAALAAKGIPTGIIDADFYGPSIPIIFGGGQLEVNHENRIIPCLRYGVRYVSIQFFLQNPDDPVIWRGPMVTKALTQMLNDCDWSGVEVLFIDMPPGTGDIQLTLSQIASLYGVILVTTPQRMSTSDVAKAGKMFEKVKVPILGIIENMVDSKTVKLFGSGGAGELATRLNTEIMGHIELNPEFVTYSDSGKPVTLSDHGKVFFELASKLIEKLEQIENTSVEIVDN